jgi:hypothetical protein
MDFSSISFQKSIVTFVKAICMLLFYSYMYKIKWKNNKYHIIGTVPKSDRKIVDRGKINTPDTIIHDRPLSMLGTGNSRKVAGID